MRTLVLQLARFGDIYQTWPVLRALSRTDEVHVLVRGRFREALEGLDHVQGHVLSTADVLAPLLESVDVQEALRRLQDEVSALGTFDKIVNLSFSPFSSYLVDLLSTPSTQVFGYTRHADGYLYIPDDSSAYFYAQVGIDRPNRYHLTEVFAAVAGVDLTEDDFRPPTGVSTKVRRQIAVHLGASQTHKTYPIELWAQVIEGLTEAFDGEIVLLGARGDEELVRRLKPHARVHSLVGETTLLESFAVLSESQLLIGGDSGPIHMASLTSTPVLNISSAAVNFWETGPTSPSSRVLLAAEWPGPTEVVAHACSMLAHEQPSASCFYRRARFSRFTAVAREDDSWSWQLLQALYTGQDFPLAKHQPCTGFLRIAETCDLAIHHLEKVSQGAMVNTELMSTIDEILTQIEALDESVRPVVSWFNTQRLRLPPDDVQSTLRQTLALFYDLRTIVSVYLPRLGFEDLKQHVLKLSTEMVADLREGRFAPVESAFHELMHCLERLSFAPTKVDAILQALEQRDFIELADWLEYVLPMEINVGESETLGQDVIS